MEQTSTVRVPLSKSYHALIDAVDAEEILAYNWYFAGRYAMRVEGPRRKRKYVYMHRQLLNPPAGLEVDHINGDKLDNRRANLRLCTRSQNTANRPGLKGASSRYKGVMFQERTGLWVATINNTYLGSFEREDDAAKAYDAAALDRYGEFARLGFDRSEVPSLPEALSKRVGRYSEGPRRLYQNNSSGIRGVRWYPSRGKWRARFYIDGKLVHLGYFDSSEEAARAYEEAESAQQR